METFGTRNLNNGSISLNNPGIAGLCSSSSTSTSSSYDINSYYQKELIDTIILEDRVELIYKQIPLLQYWGGIQPNHPKITKDIIKSIDGKMIVVETIEGEYIPPVSEPESYYFE